jgi:acetyltransferase-like isoleucine patch superfamily enzyme
MDIHPTAKIASSALIDRTWPKGIHIGRDSRICAEAVILTHDMSRGVYFHTSVGERCIVGERAIILPGISIGDDCYIMPGSLVNRDIPPNSRVMGNPAKLMGING